MRGNTRYVNSNRGTCIRWGINLLTSHMPSESYHKQLGSLLCLHNGFQALINSHVCLFCTGTQGLALFQIVTHFASAHLWKIAWICHFAYQTKNTVQKNQYSDQGKVFTHDMYAIDSIFNDRSKSFWPTTTLGSQRKTQRIRSTNYNAYIVQNYLHILYKISKWICSPQDWSTHTGIAIVKEDQPQLHSSLYCIHSIGLHSVPLLTLHSRWLEA